MSLLTSILPADLDFPAKFTSYRRAQAEIVDYCLYGPGGGLVPNLTPRRFTCIGAPAGIGKSLTSHTIGKLSGMKYVILTATKSLQDQQADEFVDGVQTVDLRGKANYECCDWQPSRAGIGKWSCEEGADEYDCPRAGKPGCTHFDRVQEARRARGIVTNYACWIAQRMTNPRALELPNERVGMLICDEAHLCMETLGRALATWVSNEDLHRWAGKETRELLKQSHGEEWGRVTNSWVDALEYVALGGRAKQAELEIEHGSQRAQKEDEYKRIAKLVTGVDRVTSHGRDNNWIWRLTKNGISFDCIWPGKYAEKYLWSGVEKVVLMSATLVPKALNLLRIPAGDYYFKEWPRQFPARNCPVYWVPTGRVGRKAKSDELAKCVRFGNQLFNAWKAHKGIVHTPSYKLARWLQSECEWGRYMYLNDDSAGATQAAEKFRRAKPPAVLVSPSFTTGHDFSDESCEWIWIPKLPFPDKSDPIVIARSQDDDEYYNYSTMQTLEQECFRGQRHENDKCTVVISDDAVGNFRNYARRFGSRWFTIERHDSIPQLVR